MAEDLTHSAAGHRGLITVFGGTGFLGRRIVRHLLDPGFPVRAASRHPERVGSVACYEFAGARVYTYKELVRTIANRIRARPRLVPLPFALWRILASAAEFLPGSPLTRNQVALMQRDNIASAGQKENAAPRR
jgi:uncharacterized protein YbjT (DUF2867 family)